MTTHFGGATGFLTRSPVSPFADRAPSSPAAARCEARSKKAFGGRLIAWGVSERGGGGGIQWFAFFVSRWTSPKKGTLKKYRKWDRVPFSNRARSSGTCLLCFGGGFPLKSTFSTVGAFSQFGLLAPQRPISRRQASQIGHKEYAPPPPSDRRVAGFFQATCARDKSAVLTYGHVFFFRGPLRMVAFRWVSL